MREQTMTHLWTDPDSVPAGTILVGWDGSSPAALVWAVRHARGERRPITVAKGLAAHVAGDVEVWPAEDECRAVAEGIRAEAQVVLDEHGPGTEVHVVAAPGQSRAMLRALSQDAEMVVVGSHGRGPVGSKVLGSVSVAVVREAQCPVVVIRPQHDPGELSHGILAAVDVDDATALAVVEFAVHEASVLGQQLTVVHAVPEDGSGIIVDNARRQLSELLAGVREKYPDVTCLPVVQRGRTHDVVLDQSRDRYLTVIGNPRHQRHHGTTSASRILERATVPVAVVPL
ncbi:universal stress protein [Nocardioides sp. GXQ0305]|uniref:universal stress protein n=1 Tax=Nocardioides sp. GXQ0305 TaxID=3423912 RepID=UPI003D7ECA54